MSLYRLDASIRTEGSHSREIADVVEREWRRHHPDAPVHRRDVGLTPVPAHAWADAVTASRTRVEGHTDAQREARALAAAEVDPLVEADELLFAVPLYNFGVSQHFKAWIDLVITDSRMASGGVPATKGKPAVLVAVRGGGYGPGTPREGWDHATDWMRRILSDVWQTDLTVIEAELTLAGEKPALEQFIPLRDASRAAAEEAARAAGTRLLAAVPI